MARILVVDDELDMVKMLERLLVEQGYEAESALDAGEAMALIAGGGFDVVVCDIVLPGASGVELLRDIKAASPNTEVIMLTGAPDVETAAESVRSGASDYLTKPVAGNDIVRSVSNALKVKRLEDQKAALEEENRQQREKLERTVRERTAELEKALSDLRNTQKQLIDQEKLRALGTMASGIAHDFNNVLMPVIGISEMLLNEPDGLDDKEEVRHLVQQIWTAGNDARKIVQRLRRVYKDDQIDYGPVSLVRIIETALSMTMAKWKEEMNARGATVEIVTDFDAVPPITGNVTELREAVTNLILNAVDAMPEGGTIALAAKQPAGDEVVLGVSDTGAGMDPETLARCQVPFFTSKGKKGSGLGLSLVQSIVERHGGKLEIESEVGKGTSVKLSFVPHRGPLTDEESGPMPEPVAPKKILVIDDELRSRNLIKHMLKSDDHEVYAAGSGKGGLDKLAETKFDLVITDRAMPLMSGDEVARRISEKNPAVRVIMLTGFGDMMKDNEEMPYGVARVMSKPLTQADLRRVMQEIFGSW